MVVEENRVNRKKDIYDAAELVFAKYGFDAAKVHEIAQNAGVAKGTIYLYFPSKLELFISLIETRIEEFQHLLEKKLNHAKNAEEVLRTLVLTRIEFYMKHLGIFHMLFQTTGKFSQEIQHRLIMAKKTIKKISSNSFKNVLPSDYPIPADTLRTMVAGAVNGIIVENLIAQKEIIPEEITQHIVNAFLPSIKMYQ